MLIALTLLSLGVALWVGWWLLLSTWSPTEPDPVSLRRIPLDMPLFGPGAMIHVQLEEAAFSYALLLSTVVVPCVYLAWHALRWLFRFRFP
jgi:hypothetical protein